MLNLCKILRILLLKMGDQQKRSWNEPHPNFSKFFHKFILLSHNYKASTTSLIISFTEVKPAPPTYHVSALR